jgi:hypothetical protein
LPDALRFILVVVLMPGLNYPGEIAVGGFPTDWGLTRWPGNPVIDVDNNPNETTEQYTPAPIRLPNGDIWVYVKGFDRIYAWKSTDDGETFALQNGDDAVLEPVAATWEEIYVVDPVATYDPDTDTIHLYYKGSDILAGNDNWQWGHATAPGSDPTDVTKDGGNPIYTEADAIADLGAGAPTDLSLSNVLKIGSTFHFYGYANHGGTYKIVHATGTDWDNPTGLEVVQEVYGGHTIIQNPSVFSVMGQYGMFYSIGAALPSARTIRVASSTDLVTWDFSDTTDIISPTGSDWEEDVVYTPHLLTDGYGPDPVVIGGKWLLYYAGLESPPGDANVGLAYLEPS